MVQGVPRGAQRIQQHIGRDAEFVVTDRGRLGEIITNLIENAIKYSPQGSEVVLRASASRDRLRIAVTDHGIGIEPSERETIFERFHQSDQSSTRRYGGIGLGLHLVRAMIQELDGRIEVDSVPGTGSTFTVTLPVAASPESAEESAAPA